jgi:hypothetical protein
MGLIEVPTSWPKTHDYQKKKSFKKYFFFFIAKFFMSGKDANL